LWCSLFVRFSKASGKFSKMVRLRIQKANSGHRRILRHAMAR